MNTPPTNIDDVIDSRDVIERIEELEGADHEDFGDAGLNADEQEELAILKALAEEGEGSPNWPGGETLIRDSYFQKYTQELAEDCGMITAGANWPNNCIDWEQAAEELRRDYMSIQFDGVDYWIGA